MCLLNPRILEPPFRRDQLTASAVYLNLCIANYYDVNLAETSWHDLGIHPHKNKRKAAAKGAASRESRERS
jgi:hypothetical protein